MNFTTYSSITSFTDRVSRSTLTDTHTHTHTELLRPAAPGGSPVLSDSPAVTRLVPLLEEDFWRRG